MSKIQQFISPVHKTGEASRKRKARQSVLKDEDYVKMPINGVIVKLPPNMKPYLSQRLIMIKLIQSLKKTAQQLEKGDTRNILVESPTGSGKTLALLASSCAWLADYKVKQREKKRSCPRHGIKNEKADSTLENGTNNSNLDATMPEEEESTYFNGSFGRGTQFTSFTDNDDRTKEKLHDLSEFLPEPECDCLPSLRIYYGTRTHKQISQVVREFNRLPYGHDGTLRHTILASREQSCLNEEVRKSGDLNAACRDLIAHDGKGCIYRNNLRNKYDNNASKLRNLIAKSDAGVWDMEDLTCALRTPQVCPYYTSTMILSGAADIIFTPFNYLLDPIIRDSTPGVRIENSIVILDEAHNLEDTCRDAASFQFRETEFYSALSSFKERLNCVREVMSSNQVETVVDMIDSIESVIKEWYEALHVLIGFTTVFFNMFKSLAETAKEPLKSMVSQQNNKFKTYLADDFKKYLIKSGTSEFPLYYDSVESEDYDKISKSFKCIVNPPKEQDIGEVTSNFVPSPVAIVLVEKFLYFMKFYTKKGNDHFYKLNFTFEPAKPKPITDSMFRKKRGLDEGEEKINTILPNFEGVMNFWSMVPSVSCTETFEKCFSLILASGTLRPTDTLKTELGVMFSAEMEGKQVVPSEQIFATIVPKGKTGKKFLSTYQAINDEFFVELAWLLRDVCSVVPKGVLVFLSSYRVMDNLRNSIRTSGLQAEIEKRKKIFYEPNRSKDLEPMLEEYCAAIDNSHSTTVNGALLFAVYRGKVSEGIDFTDDMARCVVCVGIPYPNAYDEVVRQKKAFNDVKCTEQQKKRRQWDKPTTQKENYLTGDEWYSIQAFRALNQALGRCLRHINDWGAILLVDERYRDKIKPTHSDYNKISTWVREQVVLYENYSQFMDNLVDFVKKRVEHDAKTKSIITANSEPLTPLIDVKQKSRNSDDISLIDLTQKESAVRKAKSRNTTFGV